MTVRQIESALDVLTCVTCFWALGAFVILSVALFNAIAFRQEEALLKSV